MPYRIIFIALIASGGFLKLEAIWILADIVNGLMAIPNLIALIALSGVVVAETESYLARKGELDEESDSTIVAE
jgi:AGCS family alanine or glycine:cation symporter